MNSIEEDILQAVMDWVELATSLTPDRIVPSDDEGTRRPLPYIEVKLSTSDIGVGSDETIYESDSSGELHAAVEGERRATATLNAYGRSGSELLAQCSASLYQPIIKRFLRFRKISVVSAGATQDISALVGDEREKRFVHDFDIGYAFRREQAEAEPHVERVEASIDLDSDPDFSDPLNVTVEVD